MANESSGLEAVGLKAIIFDFDGVIVESVGVKKDAFAELFSSYPEHMDDIIHYHMQQGGLSRFKKFEYIYENILQQPLTQEDSDILGQKYTDLAYTRVIQSAFVQGAKEFLDKHYTSLKLFIASGTPHDEMCRIVEDMQLEKYFQGVFGSPATKTEIAQKILQQFDILPEEAIFVGDAINDYIGANETNVRFVGRVHQSYKNPFEKLDVADCIANIDELETLIQQV